MLASCQHFIDCRFDNVFRLPQCVCNRQPENTKWHDNGVSPNQRQWHAKQNHNHQQPLSM
ncbi:hypothetical protein GCWU000324_00562 [Kingella oralis ATCC 51147]|uniref:Uncharacterized protein n=1 Tax=Kingella oralis ATCC 51147 TaxID=629741 RepID=C4GI71_9NEIS|nr:hypothetical protein GCWU000324_00562 [Kingella oralis ATCC 51147]